VALFPRLAQAAESLPLSIFARLYERLARFTGDVVPLQIGDTYLMPAEPARLCAVPWTQIPGPELYAYSPPSGWPPLVGEILAKLARKNRLEVGPSGVQITCGATHALACSVGAVLDPGDELVLLTPHWPLIKGIAQSRSVIPVEVPFSQPLIDDPSLDPVALIEAAVTRRTAGIYVSSPNNPDGLVLDERMLAAVVDVARRHDLWILSDEVYEEYVYDAKHLSIGTLPGAASRTITVFSFSKSYAQAGLRVGYAVGPEPVIAALRKMANHSVYNVPQAMQRAAHAALVGGDDFLAAARTRYRAARDLAHGRVKARATLPQGSTYLFLDLRPFASGGDCIGVLERIAEAGVLLAPGSAFGQQYEGWARLCFTAVDPDRLVVGIDRINDVLAARV
jgi:aspartate/methionine/tyrosine aminotransferase